MQGDVPFGPLTSLIVSLSILQIHKESKGCTQEYQDGKNGDMALLLVCARATIIRWHARFARANLPGWI